MSDYEKTPPEISPDQGGVDPRRQSSVGSISREITETQFPQSPFGEKLEELTSSGINSFGGRVGTQLTAAAFKNLEHLNHKQELLLIQKDQKIENLYELNTQLRVKFAESKATTREQQKTSWMMAAVFALSSILIGIGYSDLSNNSGKVTLVIGCLLFLLAFFVPALIRPKETK